VTAIVLLSESHISAHTWPEVGYVAVDVFTCGSSTRPEDACRYLAHMFEARSHSLKVLPRGAAAPAPRELRKPTRDLGGSEKPLAAADQ
jgi:S-adenosylmethionine decarboxylase